MGLNILSNGLSPNRSNDEAVNFHIVTHQDINSKEFESSQAYEDEE